MTTLAFALLVGARAAAATGTYVAPANHGETQLISHVHYELTMPASKTNAWSLTKEAFADVVSARFQVSAGSADRKVLDRLAAAYDGHLAPALRDVRHAVRFTLSDNQALGLGIEDIDVNARHGRASVPRNPDDPNVDFKGPPQPVDFGHLDAVREAARQHAAAAQRSMREGLAGLAGLEADAPAVRDAVAAMRAAFEASAAVAGKFADLDGAQGELGAAIEGCRSYMETANKALKPAPEARGAAVRAYNALSRDSVALEFELAKDAGQARFLHGEIDKLGPLSAGAP